MTNLPGLLTYLPIVSGSLKILSKSIIILLIG